MPRKPRVLRLVGPLLLALVAGLLPARRASAQAFAVVVNAANPVQAVSRDQLAKIFLKKATWASGVATAPVDLPEDAPARAAFSKIVHKRSVGAVKSYWQQQIYAGRAVPPPEKATDEEVLAYVRANPGAIGYVSVSADIGRGVKEIGVALP